MKKIQKIDFYGFDQKNSSRFLLKKTRASFPFSKDVLCGNKERSTTFTFFLLPSKISLFPRAPLPRDGRGVGL